MSALKPATLVLALLGVAGPGQSADFSDPTWPCIQRKVEQLSVGLMWPFPVETDGATLEDTVQADIAELADLLALRRVDLDSLRPQVEAFGARHGGDTAILGLVFQRVFDGLSKRRTRIIGGIGDFSQGQISLADKIDAARMEFEVLLSAETPDYDKIDALEEQIDWDQIIHTDRQRTITYLCETPQLIERRLFAIAQMLQFVAQD